MPTTGKPGSKGRELYTAMVREKRKSKRLMTLMHCDEKLKGASLMVQPDLPVSPVHFQHLPVTWMWTLVAKVALSVVAILTNVATTATARTIEKTRQLKLFLIFGIIIMFQIEIIKLILSSNKNTTKGGSISVYILLGWPLRWASSWYVSLCTYVRKNSQYMQQQS